MTDADDLPPVSSTGWTVFAHPMFLDKLDQLKNELEVLKRKAPDSYTKKNAWKRLTAIIRLAFDGIAQDPTKTENRQGNTLGDAHRHWFRAKFFQQYRLFFRYHASSKIIVLVWVNDDDSKRAYESSDDAYRVFRRMLGSGHPPDDWDQLLQEATAATARFNATLKR